MHSSKTKIVAAAKSMIKIVDSDIYSISKCFECYQLISVHGEDASFAMACNYVHPVIWAKADAFGYWPAKAISHHDGKVYVKYFGDHVEDEISVDVCYKYSPQPPENLNARSEKDERSYQDALDVCS